MADAGQFRAAVVLLVLLAVLGLVGLHQHRALQGPAPKPSYFTTSTTTTFDDGPPIRVRP